MVRAKCERHRPGRRGRFGDDHRLLLCTDIDDPHLPFIIGNLAEFYGRNPQHARRINLIKPVRAVLRRVGTEGPDTALVETTGLTSADSNYVHFNRASYIVLGRRYAQALARLETRQRGGVGSNPIPPPPR